MNPKTKNILIILFIAILAIVGYAVFFNPNTTPTGALTSVSSQGEQTGSSGSEVNDSFLSTLLSVRTLTLDDSLFQNPAFINLKDFTITLSEPENIGRTNPFAPLSGASAFSPSDPDDLGTGNSFLGN